jgi:uncharacterized membrane protein
MSEKTYIHDEAKSMPGFKVCVSTFHDYCSSSCGGGGGGGGGGGDGGGGGKWNFSLIFQHKHLPNQD